MGLLYAVGHDVQLETMVCGECGITYAMPKQRLDESRKRSGYHFYCPNGHARIFTESEADKLKKELDQVKQRNAQLANQISNERRAAEKERKRIMKRANSGVCQHCHRTFTNVARHMKTKHPKECNQ